MFPIYIKKEDVRDVVIWQRKRGVLILVSVALVMGIMQFVVYPRLINLYSSFNINPPAIVRSSFNITIALVSISIISALNLLFSQPDYTRVDTIAKKYKNGEMIKTIELADNRFEWLVLGSLGLLVAYLVCTTILPIYNLTSQY